MSLLTYENITPIFETINTQNTGLCVVICNNNDRSHYTDLGASTQMTPKFFDRYFESIQDCSLIFTELFIIRHQYDILCKLAELGLNDDKIFSFNLPSYFFIENYINEIEHLYAYADIIFCNLGEARYFANLMGFTESPDIKDLMIQLATLEKKNPKKNRIVVVTVGSHPAWVCEYDFMNSKVKNLFSCPIRPIDRELIVDTNGAGDSFAGGFLSQYMQGKSLEECMICGHWAASIIIQYRGCQIPYGLVYEPESAKDDIVGEDGMERENEDF
ncbi:MAG: PfkB family carbohydrate kinase [archaeon]|nr:PfkB family carbohydrate kinase [archaeon]